MGNGETRTTAPSNQPNNQDVFIWALYLLGGADREIHVEHIYMKAFDLAPARLAWRLYPQTPDYKKTSKALQSVEATTHKGLVLRVNPLTRKLTVEGIKWVEKFKPLFESVYENSPVQAAKTDVNEKRRQRIRESQIFNAWKLGDEWSFEELSVLFECQLAAPKQIWLGRIDEAKRAGLRLQDDELIQFIDEVEIKLRKRGMI